MLQAETLAQSAERAGKRVAQIEWAGGRGGAINGPTLDFRNFRSGRGVATNYIAPEDSPQFTASFGLQFDHPAGFAGNTPFPQAAPSPATGWTNVPKTYSPAKEMRLRVLDGADAEHQHRQVRPQRLHLRQPQRPQDALRPRPVQHDQERQRLGRQPRRGRVGRRQGQDRPDHPTDALDGKTGAFLVKVERLDSDLSHVRLFHTSVTRAIATWNGWSEPGFTGTFEDFVAERFPSSQAGDFAVLEAGIVSEETYIEQGAYWEKSYQPLIKYVIDKYRPDLAMVGYPVTDEVQHQFLGLVTRKLPNGANNPSYDDVNLDGKRDDRVKERERFIREAYEGSDETMRLAQDRMRDKDLTTFVGSDHGFAPQFLAIDASKVLVDLGLLKLPQVSNCRIQTVAQGETIGKAKACYAGGAVQIYLNVSGRDPAIPGMARQVGAPAIPATPTTPAIPAEESEASVVARVKAAFQNLKDPNDWTHDGQPENWKVIDRVYTKAEARYIPNGANSTADMAHPTRTGDVVAFSYPPYQFDAATPGTLIAPSAFFGQHGYVPDVQDLRSNTNMRATFLAGGERIDRGVAKNVRSIDLAPTAAFLLGVPAPQHSQGTVRRDIIDDGDDFTPVNIVGLNDFHGQLAPAATTLDANTAVPVGGAAQLATMFDEEMAKLPGQSLLLAAGDNVGASPPTSALLEDIPAIDVENAWGLDATSFGNHEFDFGIERILKHQARANFPFLATNVVETATGKEPAWMKTSAVFRVNGVKVGVIGSVVRNTPELVKPGNTAGLEFLDEADRIKRESAKLRAAGRARAGGRDPRGRHGRRQRDRRPPGGAVGGRDRPDRQQAAGHHRGPGDRGAHAPRGEHGHRPHPRGRGLQRRHQLLGGAVDGRRRRRQVDGRGDAPGQEPRRRPAGRREGDRRQGDRRHRAAAQRRHRQRDGRPPARQPGPPARVLDGQLRRRRDAAKYADDGVQAAITNSGGLRADIPQSLISGGEQPGQITWGEAFAVLPFGNATTIETLTYEQLVAALANGFRPPCGDSSGGTGRTPQYSGLWVEFHCNGTVPVIDNVWLAPPGPRPTTAPLGPGSTVRIVTNDFMFGGGDGYTALSGGTNVLQTGDLLLDVMIDYIKANSPITALPAAGRRAGPFS